MSNNFIEAPKDHGQGVFNKITLPMNEDYIAVSRAVSDLLKDGWVWLGIDKVGNAYSIVLSREWRA